MTMKYLWHKLYQRLVNIVINNDAYNLADDIHVHVQWLFIKKKQLSFGIYLNGAVLMYKVTPN